MKNEKIVIAILNETTITLSFKKSKFKMDLQEIMDDFHFDGIDLISNLILGNSRTMGGTFIKINNYDLIKLETNDMTNDEFNISLNEVKNIISKISFIEKDFFLDF